MTRARPRLAFPTRARRRTPLSRPSTLAAHLASSGHAGGRGDGVDSDLARVHAMEGGPSLYTHSHTHATSCARTYGLLISSVWKKCEHRRFPRHIYTRRFPPLPHLQYSRVTCPAAMPAAHRARSWEVPLGGAALSRRHPRGGVTIYCRSSVLSHAHLLFPELCARSPNKNCVPVYEPISSFLQKRKSIPLPGTVDRVLWLVRISLTSWVACARALVDTGACVHDTVEGIHSIQHSQAQKLARRRKLYMYHPR